MITDREVLHAWEAEVAQLVARCVVVDQPPRWPEPRGSDLYAAHDVREANASLARGCTVERAAQVMAARRLARAHGTRIVRDALALATVRNTVGMAPRYARERPARSA